MCKVVPLKELKIIIYTKGPNKRDTYFALLWSQYLFGSYSFMALNISINLFVTDIILNKIALIINLKNCINLLITLIARFAGMFPG